MLLPNPSACILGAPHSEVGSGAPYRVLDYSIYLGGALIRYPSLSELIIHLFYGFCQPLKSIFFIFLVTSYGA